MNFLEKLDISRKVAEALILKRRTPLIVAWNITYRCNLQCKYCGYWERKSEELKTEDILSLIEELALLGTKIIIFSGGEPLLREDLGTIIDFCKVKKIYVLINSNGTMVKEGLGKIQKADEIQLSLDGPGQINDIARGEGVYDKVVQAIAICRKEDIKVNLTTVISKYNISWIASILDIAQKYKVGIYFQPVGQRYCSDSHKDNRFAFAPDEDDYKKVISHLIKENLKGNKCINNSLAGLRHLYHWPKPRRINCLAKLISCSIEPDGKIFICDMVPSYQRYLVSVDQGFKKSFDRLFLSYTCEECWNGPMLELSLMKSFKLVALLKMWKRLRS